MNLVTESNHCIDHSFSCVMLVNPSVFEAVVCKRASTWYNVKVKVLVALGRSIVLVGKQGSAWHHLRAKVLVLPNEKVLVLLYKRNWFLMEAGIDVGCTT